MHKFFKDIITGTSNLDYEIGRVLALAGVLAYIAYGGFDLFFNARYDPQAFGIGFGAIMLGSGVGIAAKDRVHPENIPKPAPPAVTISTGPDAIINEGVA